MIPQCNPKAGYLAKKTKIDQAIAEMLDSGWYILGKQVSSFEQSFAEYIGVEHAVGVASGTDAIELILRASDIGAGSVVLTVSHTAVATVAAIERAGAQPMFVDVDPKTFTMSPAHLKKTIEAFQSSSTAKSFGKLRAILPVHIYGHPAELDELKEIAEQHDLLMIEDCAQSHGARYQSERTGSFGHASAFSFYPTKNLGALGDGGICVTSDSALAERMRALREYGWTQRYVSTMSGINSRLDEMQAAILRVCLQSLDEDNARRRAVADIYHDMLIGSDVVLPKVQSDVEHVYHQFVIQLNERDAMREKLKEQGVLTGIHYPVPVHQQPAYTRMPSGPGGLPITESLAPRILSLPMFPQMSDDDAQTVARTLLANLP